MTWEGGDETDQRGDDDIYAVGVGGGGRHGEVGPNAAGRRTRHSMGLYVVYMN
jgi:hypothetical protein